MPTLTPTKPLLVTFAAPLSRNGLTFTAAEVDILDASRKPSEASGYRFRPGNMVQALDADKHPVGEPKFVASGAEFFAPDATPSEASAQAAIEAWSSA